MFSIDNWMASDMSLMSPWSGDNSVCVCVCVCVYMYNWITSNVPFLV